MKSASALAIFVCAGLAHCIRSNSQDVVLMDRTLDEGPDCKLYTVPLMDPILENDRSLPSSKKIYSKLTINDNGAKFLYEPFRSEKDDLETDLFPWLYEKFNQCFKNEIQGFETDERRKNNTYDALEGVIMWAEIYCNSQYKYRDDNGNLIKYEWTEEQKNRLFRDNDRLHPMLRAANYFKVYGLLNLIVEHLGEAAANQILM